MKSLPVGHLKLEDPSRLTEELFQNSMNFLWMIVPRARFTLQKKRISILRFLTCRRPGLVIPLWE